MRSAPHEQAALRAIVIVLALGVGAYYGTRRAPAEWIEPGAAPADARARLGELVERAEEEGVRSRRRAQPLGPGERLDPNTADADELQRLPRVGPALAERIVRHREANGPFHTLADLLAVPGIGPAFLESAGPHLALPAAAAVPPAGPARPLAAPPPSTTRVDVNTAGAEELQRLPGIGPALAERIIAWRQANGAFRDPQELQKVPGIGPRTLEKLLPHLHLGPE